MRRLCTGGAEKLIWNYVAKLQIKSDILSSPVIIFLVICPN